MRAPNALSKEAKKWWKYLQEEYEIMDRAGILLLTTAFQAFDKMRQAQRIIASEGMYFRDRFDQMKVNPLCAVERDAMNQMLTALKHLNLDIEPLRDKVGRPGKGF